MAKEEAVGVGVEVEAKGICVRDTEVFVTGKNCGLYVVVGLLKMRPVD